MPATATVTGKVGDARTLTAGVFTGIINVNFDTAGNILSLTDSNGRVIQVDITGANTITATKVINTNTYTFVVS